MQTAPPPVYFLPRGHTHASCTAYMPHLSIPSHPVIRMRLICLSHSRITSCHRPLGEPPCARAPTSCRYHSLPHLCPPPDKRVRPPPRPPPLPGPHVRQCTLPHRARVDMLCWHIVPPDVFDEHWSGARRPRLMMMTHLCLAITAATRGCPVSSRRVKTRARDRATPPNLGCTLRRLTSHVSD